MQFLCPRCGRLEQVIGDRTPRCLVCGAALIKATESYAGLFMSPRIPLARMQAVIDKYGYVSAVRSSRFKKEREGWTSAVYALGLAELTSKEYWVEIETVDQTPDARVHYLDQSAGYNEIHTQSIEIVDWEEHVDDALEVIRAKCRKAYPSHFCLLVLARNGKFIDLEMIAREVQVASGPFAEIWILGKSSERAATMARLFPGPLQIEFDVAPSLKKRKQQTDFLCRQTLGKSTVLQDLGPIFLPLP